MSDFDDAKVNFSRNVKMLREKKGLSQEELGRATGISKTFICEIENGKKYPGPETVEKLAAGLNVEPFQLYNNEKENNLVTQKQAEEEFFGRNNHAIDVLYEISHAENEKGDEASGADDSSDNGSDKKDS